MFVNCDIAYRLKRMGNMMLRKWAKQNWQYIGAFLVPIVIMLVHCAVRGVWLFGDGSLLRGDAGLQYTYVFRELWHKVHNGDFSFFSWNAVCGFDFYLNMLYYTISPSTLIILVLPIGFIDNALQFFLIVKWALLSLSAVYFFMNTQYNRLTEYKQFVAFALGLCYALSGFFLNSLFLFNWMDSIILFPVLLVLIEKLAHSGKWRLYCVLLAIAITCNFYIAFPICIFLTFWMMLQMVALEKNGMKQFLLFLRASLLGGVMSMAVIIPSVCNVEERYFDEQDVSGYIRSIRMSVASLISRFWGYQTLNNQEMYFFVSTGTIAIFILFIFVKMNKKEKYAKFLFVCLLALSTVLGAFSYIWHGFSIPHMLEPRFGFLLVFLILVLVLDVFVYMDTIRLGHCIVSILIWMIMFGYAFFNLTSFDAFYVYFLHFLLLVFSSILMIFFVRKSISKKNVITIVLTICLIEIFGNAYFTLSLYNVPQVTQNGLVEDVVTMADDMDLADGERFVANHAGYNVGMLIDKACASGFVSYANGKLGKLMASLNMDVSKDSGFLYMGQSSVVNMLFNVRYSFGIEEQECGEDLQLVQNATSMNLYRLNETAGLGYIVDSDVKQWNIEDKFSFEVQNDFVNKALQLSDQVFVPFQPEDLECKTIFGVLPNMQQAEQGKFEYQYDKALQNEICEISFQAKEDGDYYVSLNVSTPTFVGITIDDETTYKSNEYHARGVYHIGQVKKDQMIYITCVLSEVAGTIDIEGQLSTFNHTVWDQAKRLICKNPMDIVEMKSDYVKGMINVEQAGTLMTSIPAYKGFKVLVDGKPCVYKPIADALIGVDLEEGKHEIEFVYETPYAKLGMLISFIAIVVFVLSFKVGKKKNV